MGLLRRAPRDGVQMRSMYPQPFREELHPRATFWYRFLLGRPMDGIRWTNSTFWRSATEGEDHWWLRLAGWHRLLVRLAVSYALLLLVPVLTIAVLLDAHLFAAQVALAHVLLIAVPILLITELYFVREHGVRIPMRTEQEDEHGNRLRKLAWVYVREGRRTWEQELVRPVAAVAAEVLDVSHQRPARDWVHVPRDYAQPGGHPVEISLPARFTASEAKRKALLAAVKPRLGMMELEPTWHLAGRHPRLELAAPPAPPDKVLYADYAEMLAAATEEYRPVLGVVASGELMHAEMQGDSPHTALSAGSGAGKSKLTAAIVAQALHWGWHVVIMDWKVESHEWAKGLPGVTYVSNPDDIHDMCVRIGEEVDVRRNLAQEMRMRRPRMLVVREEWNITAEQLANYWAELRAQEMRMPPEEREFMPLRSPAITAMSKLDGAGRAFGMFDFLIAQRMSNRVFNGNTDARESFGLRLLARYTMQTWKMLTPLKYVKKPSVLGRWVAVVNDEAQQFQAILGSDDQWREFAQGGRPNPSSAFRELPPDQYPDGIAADGEHANGNDSHALGSPGVADTDVDLTLDDPRPLGVTSGDQMYASELLKLVDLSSRLAYLGVTEKVLQHWRDDDPEFPARRGGTTNRGYLYDLSEVTEYARRRRASEAASKVKG